LCEQYAAKKNLRGPAFIIQRAEFSVKPFYLIFLLSISSKFPCSLPISLLCPDTMMSSAVGCIGVTGYSATQLLREMAKVKYDAAKILEIIAVNKWLVAGKKIRENT